MDAEHHPIPHGLVTLAGEHAPVRMLVDPTDQIPLATPAEERTAPGYKLSVDMAKVRAAAKAPPSGG